MRPRTLTSTKAVELLPSLTVVAGFAGVVVDLNRAIHLGHRLPRRLDVQAVGERAGRPNVVTTPMLRVDTICRRAEEQYRCKHVPRHLGHPSLEGRGPIGP